MENNVFDWAKKELSQDAVLSYVLNQKNEMSFCFINFLLKRNIDGKEVDSFFPYAIKEISGVWSQGTNPYDSQIERDKFVPNKVDVFCTFIDNQNRKHALIIEDKVESGLHNHQTIKYIGNTLEKGKQEKYCFIHFCLVKTGRYYFWQRDYYQKDIDLIVEKKITAKDELNVKSKQRLNKYLQEINSFDGIIDYHTLLLEDYKLFFESIKANKKKATWFRDYCSYLSKLPKNESWMSVLDLNSSLFFNAAIKGIKGITADNCDIVLPSGAGKKPYCFQIYGIHGPGIENDTSQFQSIDHYDKISENERYYLLVYSELHEDKINLGMNMHTFWDPNNRDGYLLGKSLKVSQELKTIAIRTIKKNPIFSEHLCKTKEEQLQLIKKTVFQVGIHDEPFKSDDWKEYKKTLKQLVNLAFKIQKAIETECVSIKNI